MIFGAFLRNSLAIEKASAKQMIYGAWVAVENFYRGLLKYGTFDEYHFFVDSPKTARDFRKYISLLGVRPERIKIIGAEELIPHLRKTRYTVFFGDGISDLAEIARLRSRYAKSPFPISAATHTISYPEMLKGAYLDNMLCDTYPFDSIICISAAQMKAVRNLNRFVGGWFGRKMGLDLGYNGRLDLLPLGIDTRDYGRIEKIEARRRLGIPRDKAVILYFGRFSIYDKMDLEPLLVAFKALPKEKTEPLLILAGKDAQGRYGNRVKKIAKDMNLSPRVRFYLNPSPDNKYLLYAASDIFVSPSDNIQESFGLTILEAMASGLAVVASDWDGHKDTVRHGKTGYLIPTYWADCDDDIAHMSGIKTTIFGDSLHDHLCLAQSVSVDIQKMTRYLAALIKNRALCSRLGQNGRRRVSEKYDWKVLVPEYERLWSKLSRLSRNHKMTRPRMETLLPRYIDSFRHYPTRMLGGGTKIAISVNGMEFLRTKKTLHWPENLQGMLSISMLFVILTFLNGKKAAAIERAEAHTREIFVKASSHNRRYHIMWLLKKGLIKLAEE